MKRLLALLFLLLALPVHAEPVALATRLKGRILLQVESRGEAWYINPIDGLRYYMKDGETAYAMMRRFGLGISEADYAKVANGDTAILERIRGRIVLRIQSRGEAYYVHPVTLTVTYMPDGSAAYTIMREQSLGITNVDLLNFIASEIELRESTNTVAQTPPQASEPADFISYDPVIHAKILSMSRTADDSVIQSVQTTENPVGAPATPQTVSIAPVTSVTPVTETVVETVATTQTVSTPEPVDDSFDYRFNLDLFIIESPSKPNKIWVRLLGLLSRKNDIRMRLECIDVESNIILDYIYKNDIGQYVPEGHDFFFTLPSEARTCKFGIVDPADDHQFIPEAPIKTLGLRYMVFVRTGLEDAWLPQKL